MTVSPCFTLRFPALPGSNVSTGCFHTCDAKDHDEAVNDGNYGDADEDNNEEHADMDDGSNRSTSGASRCIGAAGTFKS